MTSRNRNLDRGAKRRIWTHTLRPLTADFQSGALLDMENDLKIVRVDMVFAEASGASEDETITVGIAGTLAKYASYVVEDSKAIGFTVAATLLSTALLPKGTPLIVKKATAGADAASTAVISVNVHYEIVDTNPARP